MNNYIAGLNTSITDEEKLSFLIADIGARISSIQIFTGHDLKKMHPDQFRLVYNTVNAILQKIQAVLLAIAKQKAHRNAFQKEQHISLGIGNIKEQIGCMLQISALTSDIEDLYNLINISK